MASVRAAFLITHCFIHHTLRDLVVHGPESRSSCTQEESSFSIRESYRIFSDFFYEKNILAAIMSALKLFIIIYTKKLLTQLNNIFKFCEETGTEVKEEGEGHVIELEEF